MPGFTNKISRQCSRWLLQSTSPAHLKADHPIKDDIALACDEIERLSTVLWHLRTGDSVPPWIQTVVRDAWNKNATENQPS